MDRLFHEAGWQILPLVAKALSEFRGVMASRLTPSQSEQQVGSCRVLSSQSRMRQNTGLRLAPGLGGV